MKSLLTHIEDIKAKPHHVRRQVAFAAAGTGTGLIALAWFFVTLSSGTFALKDTNFADRTAASAAVVAPSDTNSADGLAGASAALGSQSGPAHIQIIDAATSSTLRSKQASQTTIPF